MKSNKYDVTKKETIDNNFDLLRLLGAFFVLLSHSFGILNQGLQQPGLWINGTFVIPSDIGLYIFFTISGYLVTQSFFQSSSYGHYLLKRFLRIVPALAVVSALCILMGGFVSNLPVREYYSDKSTWTYLLINSSLTSTQYTLPGVFTTLKEKSVNASIGTIVVEVRFYIALLIAGALTILNRKWLLFLFFVLFEALRIYMNSNNVVIPGIYTDVYFRFGTYLYLGTIFYCFKNVFPLRWFYAIIFLAIAFLTTNTIFQDVTFAAFLAYSILLIGESKAIFNIRGFDFSYGLYLYAYPVQQLLLLHFGYSINVWLHILLSVSISLVFAVLSWFFIERPALKKKNIFQKKVLP